ncbi:MAG: hypothetical protein QM617_09335 [Comamonas sp.]
MRSRARWPHSILLAFACALLVRVAMSVVSLPGEGCQNAPVPEAHAAMGMAHPCHGDGVHAAGQAGAGHHGAASCCVVACAAAPADARPVARAAADRCPALGTPRYTSVVHRPPLPPPQIPMLA